MLRSSFQWVDYCWFSLGNATHLAPLEAFRQLIENQRLIAEKRKELLRDLGTKVPGGYQAERLSEMLEERHGGQGFYDISHSLQTEVYLIPVGAKRLPSGGVEILFFKGLLFFSRQHQILHPRLHHTKKACFCPFTIDKPEISTGETRPTLPTSSKRAHSPGTKQAEAVAFACCFRVWRSRPDPFLKSR